MTLDALEEMTVDSFFARCHRGFIVNLWEIAALTDKGIPMGNGVQVPLGWSYYDAFRQGHAVFV